MSAICPRFTQNAWKKDLCSNCFKSKDEHKIVKTSKTTTLIMKTEHRKLSQVPKGIMKGLLPKSKNCKVSFTKDLTQVIGYGGEWPESEGSEDEVAPINTNDDLISTDDEDHQELKRLTKTNTDFNTNNGNLLGDPEDNIKKSFAALRLGRPQLDSDGKKQTLKISVTPFGTASKATGAKFKYQLNKDQNKKNDRKDDFKVCSKKEQSKSEGTSSPPIERAMEKSLLQEISETLEKKQNEVKKIQSEKDSNKIKFEITSFSGSIPKVATELKKSIARNAPITKDHTKPKISVFTKYSDSESNASDNENGISAYYDVVETSNGYENIPDGHDHGKDTTDNSRASKTVEDKSVLSSSQYITDMLLSAKTHSASYSLHEGRFITSKITADGLIVTKCNSDDALDSTGSSFDGSSDEETSYNMNRSESDSGIGISIGMDYQNTINKVENTQKVPSSTNSSDYEDIQLVEENSKESKPGQVFAIEKSRELAGEPDGSADPDGNLEAPALPKSPPPLNAEARTSFLHGVQKNSGSKKPEIPVKPTVNVLKTFSKRQPNTVEHQMICQLQQTNKSSDESTEKFTLTRKDGNEYSKLLKKGRAPEPPSSPCSDDSSSSSPTLSKSSSNDVSEHARRFSSSTVEKSEFKQLTNSKVEDAHSSIYTRNPILGIKSTSPVIREKDKRERATINPKFRSLNTFSSNRSSQIARSSSPDNTRKSISMSEECLAEEKKKKKFSIKKFLRMGTSKTTDNLHKKDGIYSEIATSEEYGISGKPRLVIIHPLDINPAAVEVVKEITKPPTEVVAIVTGKPPAPPQRTCSDTNRYYEINKPARPPPPKSAELRRKQKLGFHVTTSGSVKSKSDNVYANLGEIRSSIAPRKPERTASMREREAQLELAKKRQDNEYSDNISVCSSNGGVVQNESALRQIGTGPGKDNQNAKPSIIVEKQNKFDLINNSENKTKTTEQHQVAMTLEIFEKSSSEPKSKQLLSDGLKNSVLKINSTIDSYLKDKREFENMYDVPKDCTMQLRGGNSDLKRSSTNVGNRPQSRSSLQDTAVNSGVNCTRSEYATKYAFNSLANIPRVISASYCGSEMGESDIYSPYSFYGSEVGGEVANDINDSLNWGVQTASSKNRVKTTNRLRMRKGRSVVHKSIEDNYSAVVVANHEALAQVLDQLQQSPMVSPTLRPLASAMSLRFDDFVILEGVQAFVVGKQAFHAAIWTTIPVTLALSGDCNQISVLGGELNQFSGGVSGALNPITEFCDLVPSYHLPLIPSTELRMLQATISVLPRMQLDTLQSIGNVLKNKSQMVDKHMNNFRGSIPNLSGQKEQANLRNVCSVQNLSTLNEECDKSEDVLSLPGMPTFDDVMCREVGFIMLQLVNGLKNLQSKGIEEMPLTLSNVVLCKETENKDAQAKLCVLQGSNQDEDEPMGTLCKCAHVAVMDMLPKTKLTFIISEILLQERSDSLSKAKSVLEFILWGPSDVVLTELTKERELSLQRWLDLERATVLHGLVRARVELTIYDECHLMFLVRSNAKIMNEAAKIVSDFKLSDI